MKDLLDKLSTYNVFNYLLPGVLFAAFVDGLTSLSVLQKDVVIGAFLYYFLGSVVSRVGSLLVEPILLRMKFVQYAPYPAFLQAMKVDVKIEILSEQNNMYRTFIALFISVAVVVGYEKASLSISVLQVVAPYVCIVGLLLLYLFSFQKQTKYVMRRVEATNLSIVATNSPPEKL